MVIIETCMSIELIKSVDEIKSKQKRWSQIDCTLSYLSGGEQSCLATLRSSYQMSNFELLARLITKNPYKYFLLINQKYKKKEKSLTKKKTDTTFSQVWSNEFEISIERTKKTAANSWQWMAAFLLVVWLMWDSSIQSMIPFW